jgi:hypothetical protein
MHVHFCFEEHKSLSRERMLILMQQRQHTSSLLVLFSTVIVIRIRVWICSKLFMGFVCAGSSIGLTLGGVVHFGGSMWRWNFHSFFVPGRQLSSFRVRGPD